MFRNECVACLQFVQACACVDIFRAQHIHVHRFQRMLGQCAVIHGDDHGRHTVFGAHGQRALHIEDAQRIVQVHGTCHRRGPGCGDYRHRIAQHVQEFGELGHTCVNGLLIRTGHREHRHGVGWSAGQAAGQIAEYAIVAIAVEQRYIGIGDLPFGRAWQQRRIGTCLCGMQHIGFLLMRADEQRAGNNGIHGIAE